jgi:hypothetical protein
MKTANQLNSPQKMQATMAEYEKQNQLMQMHDEYKIDFSLFFFSKIPRMLDELFDESSQESEVEDLVNAVYDEIGLELNTNVSLILLSVCFLI